MGSRSRSRQRRLAAARAESVTRWAPPSRQAIHTPPARQASPTTSTLLPVLRRARRYLRSPKGYATVAFVVLALVAAPGAGFGAATATILAAVAGAAIPEAIAVRLRLRQWRVPSSAMLTGLIVGLVLSPDVAWPVSLATGAIATASKQSLRAGRSHIVNPAALGLLVAYKLFATGQSWWGAWAGLPEPFVILVVAAGFVVADRANKLPAALSFAGVYAALFAAASFVGTPGAVQEIFRPPFLNVAVFFAFFMVTDPPTSPVVFPDQIWFGALVAVASYLIYMATHGLYFVLAGVLAGNAVYALRRQAQRRLVVNAPARAA